MKNFHSASKSLLPINPSPTHRLVREFYERCPETHPRVVKAKNKKNHLTCSIRSLPLKISSITSVKCWIYKRDDKVLKAIEESTKAIAALTAAILGRERSPTPPPVPSISVSPTPPTIPRISAT